VNYSLTSNIDCYRSFGWYNCWTAVCQRTSWCYIWCCFSSAYV